MVGGMSGKESESLCCLGSGVYTGKGSRVCVPSGVQGRVCFKAMSGE